MITARVERKGDARQILDRIRESVSGPSAVKVGFPEGRAAGGVIERAVFNEFGTSRGVPERPFFRNAMADNKTKYRAMTRAEARRILAGEATMASALGDLGIMAQGDIQQSIVSLRTPPNAPATIARKGSSNPLIDTGEMRQAVTYLIEE